MAQRGVRDLLNEAFVALEQEKLDKAQFMAKPKEILTLSTQLQFNSCILSLDTGGGITLNQKGQSRRIELVTPINNDFC